jgi:hypothetical protein
MGQQKHNLGEISGSYGGSYENGSFLVCAV